MAAAADFNTAQEQRFDALAASLSRQLRRGEAFSAWYAAERSDFVRFNGARVRQIGVVAQAVVQLRLWRGQRHAALSLTLAEEPAADALRLAEGLAALREALDAAEDDPFFHPPQGGWQVRTVQGGTLPSPARVAQAVADAAQGLDVVGFYAGGPLWRGFADARGTRGWHAAESFNFEWSLFQPDGQAAKASYVGSDWSEAGFQARFAALREQYALLARVPRTLEPGTYRAYLAPAALDEVFALLNQRGGFSARELQSRRSPLVRLQDGASSFDGRIRLVEQVAGAGLAPGFTADGERRSLVALIDGGRFGSGIVSPRSAREFGLAANGGSPAETAASLELAPGTLPERDVLAALGTGLYLGNLWYLNFSDRVGLRITGLTRFAAFWVEDGRIVAPVATMRFDDSLYDLLGGNLVDLTAERQLLSEALGRSERSTASSLLPGALVRSLRLVL
ncbi:metallopeptidase TldD-related protein [Xylophilus sp.]|uniref:metallopeptidase TldD-related protein n=1 Tax=Xylophilus sp. TaxID=2653893 RepID=UPI0013BC701A|nr:metallopeptidase TldD-related protein [Xylophilus sp.]KAF1044068.1 MAG: hypothetical protein GAK38_03687 [Xylophilus sp.]